MHFRKSLRCYSSHATCVIIYFQKEIKYDPLCSGDFWLIVPAIRFCRIHAFRPSVLWAFVETTPLCFWACYGMLFTFRRKIIPRLTVGNAWRWTVFLFYRIRFDIQLFVLTRSSYLGNDTPYVQYSARLLSIFLFPIYENYLRLPIIFK